MFKRFWLLLVAIIIFAAVSRFYRLASPAGYYFDEVYHAVTSKLIARNDPRAYEWWNEPPEPNTAVDWLHPPLAKYTQALSMKLFGENSFGWRFSSAVFGILVIAMVGLLAQVYFHDKRVTLLAILLTALDGLLLSQSRIAMNDIHVTFFILATVTAYGAFRNARSAGKPLKFWFLLIGVLAGLAMGSKWSGIYVLFAIWISEFFHLSFRHLLRMFFFWGVIPFAIYIACYGHMFLQGKSLVCLGDHVAQGSCYCSQDSSFWAVTPQLQSLEARGGCKRLISHFSELHYQIWWYQTTLKATHPFQSKPLQWVFDLRPVWQYQGEQASIYNVGNPLLFWVGAFTVLVFSVLWVLHKKYRHTGFLLLIYFLVWAPWTFSPRIMFFYHYAPAVPLMATLMAYLGILIWEKDRRYRLPLILLLCLIALIYFLLYPLNTGLPMPQGYFDTVFKLFPTWK